MCSKVRVWIREPYCTPWHLWNYQVFHTAPISRELLGVNNSMWLGTLCAPPNGLGSVSDVFISVWLLSGELAVWAALVRRYIDHSSMQTMKGEFLSEMSSIEPVNWNRLCVCVCSYVWYPKITLTLQQEDHVDISRWAYGTLARWSGSLRSNSVQYILW